MKEKLFFLHGTLCIVFYSLSSNIDEVLLINPSDNVLDFGDFKVHCKDWLTFFGGAGRPDELCYNFLSKTILLRCLTFPLGSQTVIIAVLLFWIYLFLLMLVFVIQWISLHWEILIKLLPQFPLTFHQIHNRMPISSRSL